jgi:hypothetical protein
MFVRPDRAWVVSEVTPEESVQFCGVAQRCIPAGVCVVGVAAAGSMFSIPYHARSLSGEAAAAFHAQDRGCRERRILDRTFREIFDLYAPGVAQSARRCLPLANGRPCARRYRRKRNGSQGRKLMEWRRD